MTRKGPITIVTLSRPEVYNALHIDAHFELNKVFDGLSADPELMGRDRHRRRRQRRSAPATI